jgi:hypothetical protein
VAAVLAAARQDFETVSTYDYRDLSRYLHAGLRVTAKPYSTTYRTGLEGQAATGIRNAHVVQVANADLAGLIGLSHKRAVTVVHGTLTVSSGPNANSSTKQVTAVLHLLKDGSVWRISDLKAGASGRGKIPANADLRSATATVLATVVRIYGLRRHGYNALFERALASTTGDLRTSMLSQKAAIKQRLDDGNYDVSSKIVGLAVVRAKGATAEFVVAVDEFRLSRQGTKLGPYSHLLDITVTGDSGQWLLDSADAVS